MVLASMWYVQVNTSNKMGVAALHLPVPLCFLIFVMTFLILPSFQIRDGFVYASAHMHAVDSGENVYDGDQWADICMDFEVAPGDQNDLAVCNEHMWACEAMIFADGSYAYTALHIAKKPDTKR